MTSPNAWNRRPLSSSPVKRPPAKPVEQYELDDLVTQDKYGLGRVILVDGEATVVIDFSPRKVQFATPFSGLAKL